MYRNGVGLKDLVHLADWQKVQDSFSEVLGITLRTLGPDKTPLTRTSGQNRLCSEILSNTSNGAELCHCLTVKKQIEKNADIREILNLRCPFDMELFVLPVKIFSNQIVAYMTAGPAILNKRKERTEYLRQAREMGLDTEDTLDALIEINVFSYSKIRSILSLLSEMFTYMAQTGYHKKRLGEISQEITEIDPLFSSIYEEKILNALLNICALAFNVDSGSVMIVDRNTNHLHIKAASKLDKSIVKNANIKLGEGIAGVAAAMAEPIILPEDRNKNGILTKMKRGYIRSSVIVPFNKADKFEVYGVLNLNIVRRGKEFSRKDIALIKELINLTGIALSPAK